MSLPSSLSFLIANFQSFVTIRLETSNYFAWKTQVENALKANNLFEFVDNTVTIPSSHITDASGTRVTNPEFSQWVTIDRMLLSCLIATLTPSILPHIVGSEHTFQFWNKLEEKFSLLSRSHVHDLKRRLYSLHKTGSMEQYLDSIKEIVQKLAASGHHVDDEDLIFYTLNGLKPGTGYDSFQQAIRTRTEPLSFGTFSSMLIAEALHVDNNSSSDTSTILAAQSSGVQSRPVINTFGQPLGVQSSNVPPPPILPQPFQYPFPFPVSTQPQQQFYPSNYNGNNRSSRSNQRYNRNQFSGFSEGCQICGKSNHLAYSCYHRQNLAYRPPGRSGDTSGYGNSRGFGAQNGAVNTGQFNSSHFSPSGPMSGTPASYGGSHQLQGSQFSGTPQLSQNLVVPSHTSSPTAQAMFASSDVMGYYTPPAGSDGHSLGLMASSHGHQPSPSATTPWLFDSGATSHVTYDHSHIQVPNGELSAGSVAVGNGHTIPVAQSGQSYTTNSSSRELPQGALSPASFF